MRTLWHLGVLGVCSVAAQLVLAQTPSEWTSISKASPSTCPEGALARVSERAGSMRVTLLSGMSQFAQFDVALAADGSGQAQFNNATGAPNRIEIPPGTGKRTIRSFQLDGSCQWVWAPN